MSTFIITSFSLIILLFLSHHSEARSTHGNETSMDETYVPLMEENMNMMMMINESRRKLGSFQACALCTCCGGAKGLCLPSPCCYAINCNIPNRPFGFCSFLPKTCNCFGCQL